MEAEEALLYLDNENAELAFLDIDMPEMTGLVLAKKMKEKCPSIRIYLWYYRYMLFFLLDIFPESFWGTGSI